MRLRPWYPCIWSPRVHRTFSTKPPTPRRPDKFNYNRSAFEDDDRDYSKFRRVNSRQLATSTELPTKVTMLARDWIQNSLYNPHYGYFSKQAIIFSAKDPIQFNELRNSRELDNEILKTYWDYNVESGPGKQVWHTPTELFKVRFALSCVIRSLLTLYT